MRINTDKFSIVTEEIGLVGIEWVKSPHAERQWFLVSDVEELIEGLQCAVRVAKLKEVKV